MSEEIKLMKVSYAELQNKIIEYNTDRIRLQQENQQLKEELKLVESLASFNMSDNMPMVCMFKADYERNKYEYETIDKYKSILDEIREYIVKNSFMVKDDKYNFELLQILDKVKENERDNT